MTSDHHAPYVQGFTHATMAGTTGCDLVRGSGSLKTGLSSDWSLQPDSMKAESLVIADQQRRGECVPGPCTHRPSSHHAPYALGCTRATMAGTEGCHPARGSGSRKAGPSSDWGLQPAPMKSELLVIADQHAAVNAFPGLVHTARQVMKVGSTRSRWPNLLGGAV